MKIRTDQFCGLSGAPEWQSWLYRYSPVLYQELAEHLRTSRGCAHNREKMLELMERIKAEPLGRAKLLEFLRATFPHVLEADTQEAFPGQPVPESPDVPFESYNPNLLRFPRRFIIESEDPDELAEQVRLFAGQQARCEAVVVGRRAFLEYVPASHAAIAGQIPAKNWTIPAFVRARGR